MQLKTCPACGRGFQCSGDSDCWCASVRLTGKALEELRAVYTDCLCEDCLRKFAANHDEMNDKPT
jgi:hypothetical protein